MSVSVNEFKIGKKLGSGMFGTTYLAKYKKNN
jgi:serine/threonine protein kinase